jgi:hypothetical protein
MLIHAAGTGSKQQAQGFSNKEVYAPTCMVSVTGFTPDTPSSSRPSRAGHWMLLLQEPPLPPATPGQLSRTCQTQHFSPASLEQVCGARFFPAHAPTMLCCLHPQSMLAVALSKQKR